MAIKIAAQGGRLRRQNFTDRDASNIRVNTEAFDALFRTRTLTATAGNQIDYSTINRLADKIASDVQGIEDNRVDAENKSIAANVNKELNDKFLELASNPTVGIAEYAEIKEKAQAKIITKYEKKFKDAPSRQFEKLKPHLSNEFEKFRLKLNNDYLNKSKQFIVKTTLEGLDNDKDSLSKATTMGDLISEYTSQLTNYNKFKGPFFTLNGYGVSSAIQDALFEDHSVTAIKRAAVLLLENDDGKLGEEYIASDAKVYYGKEDYTKVNNYVSKEENQKIIADYLGLDLTKETDKEKFKATISVLREDIKKQDPFVKRENDVHNNNLNNQIMDAYLAGNLEKAVELIEKNDFRGTNSAKIRKQVLEFVNKKDMSVSLSHRINTNKITEFVLSNPTKAFTLFTPIEGLNIPEKGITNVSIMEAFSKNMIDINSLRWFDNYLKQDPGQQKLLTRQRNQLERIYNSVRKPIENILSDLDGFSDAQYEYQRTIWDTAYNNGIKNNIDYNDLIASDVDTLRGLPTGNKKSIFWNVITIKPTIESTKESISVTYERRNDDDLLTSPVGKTLTQLLDTIDPQTGVKVTIERAQQIFLNTYKSNPNAVILFKSIINALRRKREEAERQADED